MILKLVLKTRVGAYTVRAMFISYEVKVITDISLLTEKL
jgi:hypothetical protein